MSDFSGTASLADMLREIRTVSATITDADARLDAKFTRRIETLEGSVNDALKKLSRPGAEFTADANETTERRAAAEMCQIRHAHRTPKFEATAYEPSGDEIDEARAHMRGLRTYLRTQTVEGLPPEERRALSSFSFHGSGYLMPLEMSNRVLSCLVMPTDLSGLVDNQRITAPSLTFRIDNADHALGQWACEAGCFTNNEMPDLNEGLGTLNIKPETIRFVVCSTREVTEDAGFDFETWLTNKISIGMRATINAALVLGDGVGKPLGLLNPQSGIPICETSPATPTGQFSWQDLIMLAMEIPAQWHQGCSFLMNQRTAGLLLTMSDGIGKPILQSMQGIQDAPRWSIMGFPVHIVSQLPDVGPGATPVAFGNWKQTYLIVTRKDPTIQIDPYTAGYCIFYKAEARVGGATLCPNSARLLRVR